MTVETAEVLGYILAVPASIALVATAYLSLALAVKAFRWVRRALS